MIVAARNSPTATPVAANVQELSSCGNWNSAAISGGPIAASRAVLTIVSAAQETSTRRVRTTKSVRRSAAAWAAIAGKKLGWTAVYRNTGTRTTTRAARNA